MNIVLFGAGSAQFGCGTLGDIFQSRVLDGAVITLVDINPKTLDNVFQAGKNHIKTHSLNFTLKATTNRKEALQSADFVIISIEVGNRFQLWDMDWKMPQQYGISQIYGENGGPGGIFHALRVTPPILDICSDVNEICPDAYVFNYTNPMTAITTTVLRKFPSMKFIGLCHEIGSLTRYLPPILNTSIDNLKIRAAGLNHFSVLLDASYVDSGKDAYPDILEKAPAFFEKEIGYSDVWAYTRRTGHSPDTEGSLERWAIDTEESNRAWSDRTLFKAILETYKLLPITVDSHIGEYIAWASDAADHQGILDFYEFYRHSLGHEYRAEIPEELKERVVPIIEGIVDNTGYEEMAVNILNNGVIPDFPNGIAVEIPAVINNQGVHGIPFETYPKGFGALIRSYAGVYDLTAEAILSSSRDLVLQAVLACPMVTKYHAMQSMVDAMIDAQKDWLSYLK